MSRPGHSIALAAGGTGGHLFSAIALANALTARGHRVSVLTDTRGARFQSGVQVRAIPVARLAGGPRIIRVDTLAVHVQRSGLAPRALRLARLAPAVGASSHNDSSRWPMHDDSLRFE